tara:strand:- start:196 stop:363 length:168 start_codon:yes stop_codon:yes gene_type:complete
MYASYFVLFLHFAVMAYCAKPRARQPSKTTTTRNPAAVRLNAPLLGRVPFSMRQA